MRYLTGILMVATCAWSALALPPCTCTRNYKPVCGSDGATYSNECLLNCQRHTTKRDITVAKEGECDDALPDNCICTYEYRPVCGSDGTTYPNKCALGCARARSPSLKMQHDGGCKTKREAVQVARLEPCMCTREMKPVCGSDGATYSNPCILNCATQANPTLSVKNAGPCEDRVDVIDHPEENAPSSCACTRNLAPVCGSDGITYNNPCLLNCATQHNPTLGVKHVGSCEDRVDFVDHAENDDSSSCACTRNLAPVCGSNGITYNNPCLLNCATQHDPTLGVKHTGACEERVDFVDHADNDDSSSCACTRNLAPVCGSDGVTYNNPCLLNCATQHDPTLGVKYEGPCKGRDSQASCACARNFEPVCASDGVTYSNLCLMRCKGGRHLTVVRHEPC